MIITYKDFIENIQKNKFKLYEHKNFYYLWKIHNIASSFGKSESVLDLIQQKKITFNDFIENQLKLGKEKEYGLLNRLDNDTAGLLYFAKNMDIYNYFKNLQKNNKIEKYYYASVENIDKLEKQIINYPIMHKNKTKMIVIKEKTDIKKGRGKQHFVQTEILIKKENFVKIKIYKGIRHQIRVHLASINHPIIGDKLYNPNYNGENLQLYSIGFNIKNV